MNEPNHVIAHNWMNRIVQTFLQGSFSILLILISLLVGGFSLWITPREEDPQIVVPVADVFISMPGATAAEVERQVATRLEKLLYQIDGVEYVYSMSFPSQAVVTVRFFVGEDREASWVKLHNKITANIDQVPPGVAGWVIKPVEIDDVPIVNLTLYSDRYGDYELRRMAEELEIRLQAVKNTGRTYVVGGRARQIKVLLSPSRLAGRNVDFADVVQALQGANVSRPAGQMVRENQALEFQAGRYLRTAEEVGDLVVAVAGSRPVYLKEVADVTDGPAEADVYSRIAFGPSAATEGDPAGAAGVAGGERYQDYPAVTVAVAKRKGANAVWVSRQVQAEAAAFAAENLPEDVHLRVTRDFGKTANDKVNDLVEALVVAILIVVAVLAYTLGWREAIVIAIAIPVCFSFTLLINYLTGYTINRVTLFALILSLGLVVDDPIVDVENIHRHFAMGKQKPFQAVLTAINEVRPPIILATFAVIVSFLPLSFITGMMGPYMAPMAVNVPVAMLMSLLVAFTITPWLSYHILKRGGHDRAGRQFVLEEGWLYKTYRAVMRPVFRHRPVRYLILLVLLLMMAFCGWLVLSRRVPLKMLPLDNKNEFQVVIDMPEGTTLEETEAAARAIAEYLVRVPEATDVTRTVGTASPVDFNGLIRHYYLRRGDHVADVRFNMLEKKQRIQQSHAIVLRLRNDIQAIAARHGANCKIVESPPGPPVISTVVAEVYGRPDTPYGKLIDAAGAIRRHMAEHPDVVDVDDISVAPQKKLTFEVDRVKATLHGIPARQIAAVLSAAVLGEDAGSLRLADQVQPVRIRLQLPRADRSRQAYLEQFVLRGSTGAMVRLGELGRFVEGTIDQPIYHKNLKPVAYVFGETAGTPPPEAVLELSGRVKDDPALNEFRIEWAGEGEWDITLRAFRDLGAAFAVAILGIYILLLYQTQSYLLPAIQLVALPLSIIGILPGFWLLNLVSGETIGGYAHPIYFTATAMIGMIALSGIATRNSILLIEFVEARKKEGQPLVASLIKAGALRTTPIVLTSLTAMLAAWPITLDPIFSGLAWALIFGLLVCTLFTIVVVPMIYYMAYGKKEAFAR
ncbi:MAG: efflux RND transporter permease subunit [Sedimentisphaerales bacterium]|nr:efflux RND transporter permease subunit [Sedimentisphaerales bacterium]